MLFATPLPFTQALEARAVKSLLPTDFRTRLLREIPAALRERAMFSAGVTKAEFLQPASDAIDELVAGTADRAAKRAQLKQLLQQLGYRPAEGEAGTLTDLSSDARLNLILDTNLEMAQGYGHFAEGQDQAILDQWPAQELIRVANFESLHKRDWPAIWVEHGGQFYAGRMIALKNDPIWIAISRFGLPYAPFDFNSGMDVQDVGRDEAIALGLIDRDTQIQPQDRGFNADLQASPDIRDRALKSALQDLFQGLASFDQNGVLRWIGSTEADTAENAFDPNEPRNENGRWTDAGGNPIGSRPRDFLGRLPAEGEAHLPAQHNVERARAAIGHLRRRRRGGVPDALYLPTLGKVEIPWGRTGRKAPDARGVTYTEGYGLSHILAKHGETAARSLPETLAKGQVFPHPTDSSKRIVAYKNWQAIVGKTSPHSAWAITHFDPLQP